MKLHISFGLAAAIALFAAGTARAGFTTILTDITNTPDMAAYPDAPGGALGITAPSSELPDFHVWGTITSDPDMTLTERITNNSGVPWDSYSVTINPDPNYIVTNLAGLAPSGSVTNWLPNWHISPDGLTLTFDGGQVPAGQTLYAVFGFTITDSTDGGFGFHVLNAPHLTSGSAPEPASLAMVGLGAGLLLRRRRRA